ncbi:hypothetical protein IFM89_033167 [Coptis chinensis]|uniref:F-box domain-containing protein n=1 Tax=Coptis chinensis TaxID=261450 RepID=A0A835M5E3_9MAGN|nr:hypothetical protein IFM89_033167 [Coptis chinensis]
MESKKREKTEIATFIKKVYKEVGRNDNGHNASETDTIFMVSVHAVLLEFGFVCVDPLPQKKIDGFRLPEGWTSRLGYVRYTVPDLVGVGGEVLETVEFKFQALGKFVIVYGSLSKTLHSDLCEKTGLILPPCFMRLPTDLQLRILKFLPGASIAKVSCVSSELRDLSSNDDLWKQKNVEEFWKDLVKLPWGPLDTWNGHWKLRLWSENPYKYN